MSDNKSRKMLCELLSHVTKDGEEMASLLINKYHSFYDVLCADDSDILATLSGDMSTTVYIKLVSAIVSRRFCDKFKFGKRHTEEEISDFFVALFFGRPNECAYMISIDSLGKSIACDRIGDGTVNASNVLTRRMVELAKIRGAKRVIIAHNHPMGYAEPSEEDKASTNFLRSVLLSSNIELSAHYVVGGGVANKIDF